MHRRRKWQPTPVFLPGESRGRGSLVGCRLWGCTESDTTEATEQRQQQPCLFSATLAIRPTLSFPRCVHKSVFCVHRRSCKAKHSYNTAYFSFLALFTTVFNYLCYWNYLYDVLFNVYFLPKSFSFTSSGLLSTCCCCCCCC